MANAGCINAIGFDGTYLRTLDTLDSANIGVGVQYCIPAPLDDKRLDYIKYTDKCGCTCCITGENEILVYATNGVIKNFTLTNDDTNEVVNVKWNDLFGSNRAYTMVRYKTGSYPTSITDGTLAVKETTKNQYSSSGYNVSGLTDGTTYYFTAFAVSQDGTIIVVQTNSITPEYLVPSTYQAVEYIQSSGTQYISTGYNPKQNTEFEIEYEIVSYNQKYSVPMGTRKDHNYLAYYFGYQNNDNSYYGFGNNKADPSSVAFHGIGVRRKITYHNNILSNGTQSVNVATNQQPYGTILIFGEQHDGNAQELGAMKLYMFTLREGTTKKYEFIPCYRKSDSVIGLRDRIGKSFYTNAGSGTFGKGDNI